MKKKNFRFKVRMVVSAILLCAIMISFTVPAHAYLLTGWRLPVAKSTSYTWGSNLQSSGSILRNAWERATDDWYEANLVDFYYYSNSANVLNSYYLASDNTYGYVDVWHTGGILDYFRGYLNAGATGIGNSNVARSTANHEFGHVLGLDDLTSGTAIMNVNRNRGNIYIPQADDVNGVLAIYGYTKGYSQNGDSENFTQTDKTLTVSYDFPVAADLQQMIDNSDYIVVGEYTGLESTWNMARNIDNIKEEDLENYVEGHLYNFKIEASIKGNIEDKSILVNHKYSERKNVFESNAVIDREGCILKEATESNKISFEINSPLFVEPELNCKYILFLSKDSHFGNYYAAIEPFSVKIINGNTVLESNLLNKTTDLIKSVKVSGSKVIDVNVDLDGISLTDEITGKSSDGFIRAIKDIINSSKH